MLRAVVFYRPLFSFLDISSGPGWVGRVDWVGNMTLPMPIPCGRMLAALRAVYVFIHSCSMEVLVIRRNS